MQRFVDFLTNFYFVLNLIIPMLNLSISHPAANNKRNTIGWKNVRVNVVAPPKKEKCSSKICSFARSPCFKIKLLSN